MCCMSLRSFFWSGKSVREEHKKVNSHWLGNKKVWCSSSFFSNQEERKWLNEKNSALKSVADKVVVSKFCSPGKYPDNKSHSRGVMQKEGTSEQPPLARLPLPHLFLQSSFWMKSDFISSSSSTESLLPLFSQMGHFWKAFCSFVFRIIIYNIFYWVELFISPTSFSCFYFIMFDLPTLTLLLCWCP